MTIFVATLNLLYSYYIFLKIIKRHFVVKRGAVFIESFCHRHIDDTKNHRLFAVVKMC